MKDIGVLLNNPACKFANFNKTEATPSQSRIFLAFGPAYAFNHARYIQFTAETVGIISNAAGIGRL
jgi:hypothetical protein